MSKEKKTETSEAEVQEGNRIYELGFHFVPTISEDDAAVQFSHLKSIIEKKNGTFISEEAPALINLAYELTKDTKAVRQHYNNAYFGWVKFEIDPGEIAGIEKEIKLFEPMLRYLLISTVRESTLAPTMTKDGKRPSNKPSDDAPVTDEAAPAVPAAEAPETQIDKSIDELVK
jgi:ribosomal protein S6